MANSTPTPTLNVLSTGIANFSLGDDRGDSQRGQFVMCVMLDRFGVCHVVRLKRVTPVTLGLCLEHRGVLAGHGPIVAAAGQHKSEEPSNLSSESPGHHSYSHRL